MYDDGKFVHIHIRACRWDLGFALPLGLGQGSSDFGRGFFSLLTRFFSLIPLFCVFVENGFVLGFFHGFDCQWEGHVRTIGPDWIKWTWTGRFENVGFGVLDEV